MGARGEAVPTGEPCAGRGAREDDQSAEEGSERIEGKEARPFHASAPSRERETHRG